MDNKLYRESLKKSFNLLNVFKWLVICVSFIVIIWLLVILALSKNISSKSFNLNLILVLCLSLIDICFIILLFISSHKNKLLIIKGKEQNDTYFISIIDECELNYIDRSAKISKVISQVLVYIFLTFIAIIVLFPFYWMIISSLKTLDEYQESIPTFWPRKIVWNNYVEAYNKANLGILFINTLYVGLVSTILSLIITVITAFAFARLEFKGKNLLFAAMLATMMIPGELFTITNYATINDFKWISTFAALIIPFLVSVFYIYLLRQNFMQIPDALYLAAKVDGTSDLKYLLKVMVPLSLPTLISITILKMMGAWSSYVWPNLVAKDDAHELITNGLRNSFTNSTGDVNYPVQMAAVAIVSAPLFIVFIFLRKYIMKGVSRSGIKG